MDHLDLVRRGYDNIADEYLAFRHSGSADIQLLQRLTDRLPDDAVVLDAGCGAGLPIARRLAERFRVTGVDFSVAQLALARDNVPAASFLCQDLTALGFAAGSFDAICSYYAIIHVPREYHSQIFAQFCRLLAPGGLALLCLGAEDLPEDVAADYFGTEMYWSHFDAASNRRLLQEAGFRELWSALVPDALYPAAAHLFVLAEKADG